MSRILEIVKKTKERNIVQDDVPAVYCVFEKDGNKYFQIDTYGNRDRECPEQANQMIQFDKVFAKKLVSIIIIIEELWN